MMVNNKIRAELDTRESVQVAEMAEAEKKSLKVKYLVFLNWDKWKKIEVRWPGEGIGVVLARQGKAISSE
jgi:hypothetical protein